MLTIEEYGQMKEQLLQMTNEREEMDEQINQLLAKNSQIPILRKELAESQLSYESLKKEFEATQLKLNEDFVRLSNPSLQKSPSHDELENKLRVINEQHQKVKKHYDDLFVVEGDIIYELENAAQKENQLQLLIDDGNNFSTKFDVIIQQLQTCRHGGIMIEDLSIRLDKIKGDREAQNGRRYRLTGWKQQAKSINEAQSMALSGLEKDLKIKIDKLYAEEEHLSKKLNILAQSSAHKSEMELNISKEESKNGLETKNSIKIVEEARQEVEKLKAKYDKNNNDLTEMESLIQNHKRNEQKSVQKKIGMVRDLEKRLQKERQNIPRIPIDSPFVEELTKTVDAEMREKEQIFFQIRSLERELKRYQEEATKKGFVIKEVSTVPPFAQPLDDQRCYNEFLNFCKETEIKHLNFVSDLQGIAELISCIEQENAVLKETLSEVSQ